MRLSDLIDTVTGKLVPIMGMVIIALVMVAGYYYMDRNIEVQKRIVLEEKLHGKAIAIKAQNLIIEMNAIDAAKKKKEFEDAMARKPKYKTVIEYVPTGDKCKDYQAIINEARGVQ